jgi:hypothetical protein
MNNPGNLGRRAMLATMAKWSGAALALAGLDGLSTGCGGSRSGESPVPEPSGTTRIPYTDYANAFDYSDYTNYINGPNKSYTDYANLGSPFNRS